MGLRLFGRWAGVEAALGVADWAAEEEDAAVFAFVLFVDVEAAFAFGLVAVATAAVEDVRCGATGVGAGRDDADELIAAVEGAVVVVVLVAGASSA